jgi:hypothetical protein
MAATIFLAAEIVSAPGARDDCPSGLYGGNPFIDNSNIPCIRNYTWTFPLIKFQADMGISAIQDSVIQFTPTSRRQTWS